MRRWACAIAFIGLLFSPAHAQTPSGLQTSINAIDWNQSTGQVQTTQVEGLFNQIVTIFETWAAPATSSITVNGTTCNLNSLCTVTTQGSAGTPYYAPNVSGNSTYLTAVNQFGGETLVATAATNNAIVGAAVQDGSNGNSFPVGVTGYGYLNSAGKPAFGVFGRSDCHTAGVCTNELDSFNYSGAQYNTFPANEAFGTTQVLPISLQFGSYGTYPSYSAMYVPPPSVAGTEGYTVVSYYGYGSGTYGLVMDATTSVDIPNPLLIKTAGASGHVPITLQDTNAGVAALPMLQVLNSGGSPIAYIDQQGAVLGTALITGGGGVGVGSIRSAVNGANYIDASAGSSAEWIMRAGATPTTVFTATATAFAVALAESIGGGSAITSSGPGGALGNPAFVASSVSKTCGATIVVTNGVVTSC
jgi:hypothetical protein